MALTLHELANNNTKLRLFLEHLVRIQYNYKQVFDYTEFLTAATVKDRSSVNSRKNLLKKYPINHKQL